MNTSLASTESMVLAAATSCHPLYNAENIIDGSNKSFWCSTGLFPQEIIFTFKQPAHASKLITSCIKGIYTFSSKKSKM